MILDIAGIDTYYGETQALFDVSLGVDAGEVLALLGYYSAVSMAVKLHRVPLPA